MCNRSLRVYPSSKTKRDGGILFEQESCRFLSPTSCKSPARCASLSRSVAASQCPSFNDFGGTGGSLHSRLPHPATIEIPRKPSFQPRTQARKSSIAVLSPRGLASKESLLAGFNAPLALMAEAFLRCPGCTHGATSPLGPPTSPLGPLARSHGDAGDGDSSTGPAQAYVEHERKFCLPQIKTQGPRSMVRHEECNGL